MDSLSLEVITGALLLYSLISGRLNGAVLPYRSLLQSTDPQGYLLDL
jgi:hypothetical protein